MIFQFSKLVQQEKANLIAILSCKGFFKGSGNTGLC